MISIAICDDEIVLCNELEKILRPYVDQNKATVEVYYSGEKLYQDLKEGTRYDMVLLDIELDELNAEIRALRKEVEELRKNKK